jgi:hypothetical protein
MTVFHDRLDRMPSYQRKISMRLNQSEKHAPVWQFRNVVNGVLPRHATGAAEPTGRAERRSRIDANDFKRNAAFARFKTMAPLQSRRYQLNISVV